MTQPALSFAPEATLSDVITFATTRRVRPTVTVQPTEDPYIERVDLYFPTEREARVFVGALWNNDAWTFLGEAHVSAKSDRLVVVVVDTPE